MIIKTKNENILKSEANHIAFVINTNGTKDTAFAEEIANTYWPELKRVNNKSIGDVISKTIDNKTFYALVCYSQEKGWMDDQADIIKQCFDSISTNGEPISTIAIGTRFVERIQGADFGQIICGMHDSEKEIVLYNGQDLDEILNIYHITKQTKTKKIKYGLV